MGHDYGSKSPVFSKQTFSILILVDSVDKGRDSLTPRNPNIASHKSTHVIVMQYGNNNRLSFNHVSGTCLLSLLPLIIAHVIMSLDINSLNNNCWKTMALNLKKGIIE